jgi:hypothetical protein
MSTAPGSLKAALRKLRLEHWHQWSASLPIEQLQLRRVSTHRFVVVFDLRGLFARADHEGTARRKQRMFDEAMRRPV